MEDEIIISSILVSIKERYCNLKAIHRKHCLCHLKKEQKFEILELKGDSDGSNGRLVPTAYSNLFSEEYATVTPVSSKTILVQGEAGVGKTMLCLSILEDWATGKLFQKFQIIIFLPLRNVASASTLNELLNMLYPDFSSDVCSRLATYLEKNNKYSILIIADGWESLQLSQCRKESFFHSLLFSNDIIPTSSVTVLISTALPSCIHAHILEPIDRFITLAGFDRMVMESIIQYEFKDDVRMTRYLTAQLNDNPLIASICRTPLQLAILCDLCRSQRDTEPLPNTTTELYAKLVWTLAAKSININDTYRNTFSLSKCDDLPKRLQRPWQLLCELAFRNVDKGHNNISQLDASKYALSEMKLISYFGLIKPIVESGDIQILSISFLHPCFEQYLASLHLALQPYEAQLTLMKELESPVNIMDDNKVITSFWNFFVSNYVHIVTNESSNIIAQALRKNAICSDKATNFLILCHLSFEAKDPVVNQEIFNVMNIVDNKVLRFGHSHSVYDFFAMIYVIENIPREYEIEINFEDCNLSPEHVHNLANVLAEKSDKVQITGLNLSNNKLNDSLAVAFFSRSTATFKSLRILILRSCEIGTSFDIQAILSALTESSCQTLTHLDLFFNPISMSFLRILQDHIQRSVTFDDLLNLSLKGSFKTDISVAFLSKFCGTLSSRCKHLRRLDLSDNNFGQPGNPDLRNVISRLLSLGRDFHLCLNEKYMYEVNNEFICVMEETIKSKGTINHTIAHGLIVGPGRSGKNTLMNRLMGNGPPDPDSISPSTGVLENIVKVEVKKLSTVATAVSNLEWMKLKHDEEALELIMTTARHHSAPMKRSKPLVLKYVLKEHKEVNNGKTVQSSCPPKYSANIKQRKEYKIFKLLKN